MQLSLIHIFLTIRDVFLRSQAFLTGRDVHEYDGESNDCDAFLGARVYQNA